MNKIILLAALATSAPAFAQHHYYGQHHGHWHRSGGGWVWVVPTIVGGVIGYEIAKSQQPVIVQQPVVIPPQTQNCSPWTETQNPDGTITRTRTCTQ